MTHVDSIIQKFGGITKMAATIGRKKQTVSNWKIRERIPSQMIPEVYEAAKVNGIDVQLEELLGITEASASEGGVNG